MTRKQALERLERLLNLPARGDEQDWEVELADASRLKEFLDAYGTVSLSEEEKFALMSLILASADQYLGVEERPPPEWEAIASELKSEYPLYEEALRYWAREEADDPDGWFLLTPLVRAVMLSR